MHKTDEELLADIRKACSKYRMYIVVKNDGKGPFYLVYRKHPNPDVKLGIGLGRRSTLHGLRLHVNRLIPCEADHVEA